MQIFNHPFIIVIPSAENELSLSYFRAAQQISAAWYIYGRGITHIVRDSDVFDGDAARYNMIVLGGPKHNSWTRRREHEGSAVMGLLIFDYFAVFNV